MVWALIGICVGSFTLGWLACADRYERRNRWRGRL
jgi:hypothetical protein